MTETLEKLIKIFKQSLKDEDFLDDNETKKYLEGKIKEYEEIISNVKAKKNTKKN